MFVLYIGKIVEMVNEVKLQLSINKAFIANLMKYAHKRDQACT